MCSWVLWSLQFNRMRRYTQSTRHTSNRTPSMARNSSHTTCSQSTIVITRTSQQSQTKYRTSRPSSTPNRLRSFMAFKLHCRSFSTILDLVGTRSGVRVSIIVEERLRDKDNNALEPVQRKSAGIQRETKAYKAAALAAGVSVTAYGQKRKADREAERCSSVLLEEELRGDMKNFVSRLYGCSLYSTLHLAFLHFIKACMLT